MSKSSDIFFITSPAELDSVTDGIDMLFSPDTLIVIRLVLPEALVILTVSSKASRPSPNTS